MGWLSRSDKKSSSFRERVAAFWDWFVPEADRFRAAIDDGTFEKVQPEFSKGCSQTLGGLSWVFGPGEDGGHSLTVTGEGLVVRQMLAEYWKSQAPKLPGWTFYASRQPSDEESLRGISIGIPDCDPVDADGFLIRTVTDEDNAQFDITAWHPTFTHLPEEHHMQLLFLLLDEALGEFGTQTRIGAIEIAPLEEGDDICTLADLPKKIRDAEAYFEWPVLTPTESYTLFEIEEGFDDHRPVRRFGSTCIPNVISELINHGGSLPEDPLQDTGAELITVSVDFSVFEEGREAEIRGEIEDRIGEALQQNASGRTVGGAWGQESAFIDALLFDADTSRTHIRTALKQLHIEDQCRLINMC